MQSSASHSVVARTAIMSKTGWMFVGDSLITRRISAVAVCRSSASFVSLNTRTFSIAMTAWAANVSMRAICFRERLDFELVEDDDAQDFVSAKHGHPKFGVDGIDVSQRVAVFVIRLEVSDVNRPFLECDSGRDR